MINDDVQYPNFRILYKFNLELLNSKHAFSIKCNAQLSRSNSEGKTQNSFVFKVKYPNSNIFQHKGKHSVKKMGRFSLVMYVLLVFLKFSQPNTFFHSRLIKFRGILVVIHFSQVLSWGGWRWPSCVVFVREQASEDPSLHHFPKVF